MLHGENPEEILSNDIRGLYFYFSNKKIRHKVTDFSDYLHDFFNKNCIILFVYQQIFHPFYLAARFNKSINLYYLNDENTNNSLDLAQAFLKI